MNYLFFIQKAKFINKSYYSEIYAVSYVNIRKLQGMDFMEYHSNNYHVLNSAIIFDFVDPVK